EIAAATGKAVPETARVFLDVGERLGIDDLADRSAAIASTDQYDRLAIARVLDQLAALQSAFTRAAIAAGGWESWSSSEGDRIARARRALDAAAGESVLTLSRLLVAAAALNDLATGTG